MAPLAVVKHFQVFEYAGPDQVPRVLVAVYDELGLQVSKKLSIGALS
jgi:hypothetical protein